MSTELDSESGSGIQANDTGPDLGVTAGANVNAGEGAGGGRGAAGAPADVAALADSQGAVSILAGRSDDAKIAAMPPEVPTTPGPPLAAAPTADMASCMALAAPPATADGNAAGGSVRKDVKAMPGPVPCMPTESDSGNLSSGRATKD